MTRKSIVVGRLDLVDRDDVRVVERRGGFGFLKESLATRLVRHAVVREDLDRDLAPQPRVARAIDLAHATRAKQREDFIRAEMRPGGQGHCGLGTAAIVAGLARALHQRTLTSSRSGPAKAARAMHIAPMTK